MPDERNVAHDKKVAHDKEKAAHDGAGKDSAANVDGDGHYMSESHKKHPTQPGKKPPQADDDAAEEA